jgi:hypothetical protein
VGGVFGAWESSLAQVKTKSKQEHRNSFFIIKFSTFNQCIK